MKITDKLTHTQVIVDKALDKFLPSTKMYPAHLAKAMRYSVFSGGKRVRPFLVLEAAALCGGNAKAAMPIACATEMIHAYSLVHDDLPAMDDDDYRRGKKTCHKQFDEATAILTGDALLSLAFQVLAETRGFDPSRVQKVTAVLSKAIGPYGMVGGQAADLKHQQKSTELNELREINRLKTGELITASCQIGAIWAGGSKVEVESARKFGVKAGFLFQLIDDIIDGDGYVGLIGKDATYALAARTRDEAKQAIQRFGKRADTLRQFADFLHDRKH